MCATQLCCKTTSVHLRSPYHLANVCLSLQHPKLCQILLFVLVSVTWCILFASTNEPSTADVGMRRGIATWQCMCPHASVSMRETQSSAGNAGMRQSVQPCSVSLHAQHHADGL